jgi:uncharacterized protein involved in exopolysaccharide biosynthesis
MNNEDNQEKTTVSNEISVKDIFTAISNALTYLKSRWIVLLAVSIIGACAGFAYAGYKKPVYSAICTFVLDDGSKGGSLGQYAGLASLAGLGVGGSGDLFQGDNIIELYKSRLMIEKTLLSRANFDGKNELLIDRYIAFNKLRAKWRKKDNIDSITFNDAPEKFNRHQDSIITDIVDIFNKSYLTVNKPDKKLSIIEVGFNSKDELFAKEFTNKLVVTVNDFFVATKTKKSYQNVQVLQHQADSVKQILNSSISGVASATDASPNANPMLQSLRVPSQKRQVDVQASSAVYGEIVKNLELAKINLREEKPLIQIIDSPVLPLPLYKLGKIKAIIIGFALGFCFIACWLLFTRFLLSFKWK